MGGLDNGQSWERRRLDKVLRMIYCLIFTVGIVCYLKNDAFVSFGRPLIMYIYIIMFYISSPSCEILQLLYSVTKLIVFIETRIPVQTPNDAKSSPIRKHLCILS
jgi:hypothetical protein